jgi:peptide/nickel transport system permease protein
MAATSTSKPSQAPNLANEGIYKKRSQFSEVWSRLKQQKVAMISLAGIIILVLIAVFADVIANYDTKAIAQNVMEKLQEPSAKHWFGTDGYGRDYFARIIHGVRTAMLMGVFASLVSIIVSTLLAVFAAYFGGKSDMIIMRAMDVLSSIPSLIISIAIVAGLGNGLWQLVVALAAGSIAPNVRMIRSVALGVSKMEYIEAAVAQGASTGRIMTKYIFPNIISIVIIQATQMVGGNILFGASLSFIGLGIKPPRPEWGVMLSQGMSNMQLHPFLVIIPGVAIVITSLVIMTFGDCLRDAYDPHLKGKA